jgi:hypothetical protein
MGSQTLEVFLAEIEEPRRTEIARVDRFIRDVAPELDVQVGKMINYGPFRYKYASGREGEWARISLASQKNYISIYACAATEQGYVAELSKDTIGKVSVGKSCIRFKKLNDLNLDVLRSIVRQCAEWDHEIIQKTTGNITP